MRKCIFLFALLCAWTGPSFAAETTLPSALQPLQLKLYQEGFTIFLHDFHMAHPEFNFDPAAIPLPQFDPKLSRNDWLDLFSQQVVKSSGMSAEDGQKLTSVAADMFTSYYHNIGYARLPYMQVYVPSATDPGAAEIRGVEKLTLRPKYLDDQSIDVQKYVNERFSRDLQEFLQAKKADLNLHDSSCADAYAYQKSKGYTQAIQYMSVRDQPDTQTLIVINPKTAKYRVAYCDIHGNDGKNRAIEMLGPIFYKSGGVLVHHAHPVPLLRYDSNGQALRIDPVHDKVLIGFQNTVWWALEESSTDWHRTCVTKMGTDISIFYNSKTQEQYISVGIVYGDEMVEILNDLYNRGARIFVHFGTAGGLADKLQLGDVLLPARFMKEQGWTPFKNNAAVTIPGIPTLIPATSQGWISTLLTETKTYLRGLMQNGAQALDVEGRYFAEFFNTHPDGTPFTFMIISDLPFGAHTYDDENATRITPIDAVKTITRTVVGLSADNGKKSSVSVAKRTVPVFFEGRSPALIKSEKEYHFSKTDFDFH